MLTRSWQIDLEWLPWASRRRTAAWMLHERCWRRERMCSRRIIKAVAPCGAVPDFQEIFLLHCTYSYNNDLLNLGKLDLLWTSLSHVDDFAPSEFLRTAALNCHVNMVRCLMDANADAHQADQDGVTPLEISMCGEAWHRKNWCPVNYVTEFLWVQRKSDFCNTSFWLVLNLSVLFLCDVLDLGQVQQMLSGSPGLVLLVLLAACQLPILLHKASSMDFVKFCNILHLFRYLTTVSIWS